MDLTLLVKIWGMDYTLDAFTFLESIHFLLITMPLAYEGLQVTDKTVFSIKKKCAVICQKIVMIVI